MGGIIAFCAAGLTFIAAILYFCTCQLADVDGTYAVLGYGAICCGVFSLLNAGALAFNGVLGLKK